MTYRKKNLNNEFNHNDNILDNSKIILELESKYDTESISIIKDLRRRKSEMSVINHTKNSHEENTKIKKPDTNSDTNLSVYIPSKIIEKKENLNQTSRMNNSSSTNVISSPPSSFAPSRVHHEKLKPVMPSHDMNKPPVSKIQGNIFGVICLYVYLNICMYVYVYKYIKAFSTLLSDN